ncbi:hypothetical protein [Ornithinimicrobium kibberense]|uniref:hypothetical protein n=1 Tax=Ornithinimicrobium kibberense TaxID=282060 RepID=UPI00361B4E16
MVSPRREERTASPERSCWVNSSPARPRLAWVWSICSARVDFPQSMVPVKKTSSATGAVYEGAAAVPSGCDPPRGTGPQVRDVIPGGPGGGRRSRRR